MNTQLQAILKELRTRFERLYGERLLNMVLYGSQARGDADAGSDIDVMVVLDGTVDPCLEIARTEVDVADVSLENNVAIVCVFVSRQRYETEQSPLLINVRREAVQV